MANNATRIAFIIPFFGEWPAYASLFFKSCASNQIITVLVLSEKPVPFAVPENVQVKQLPRRQILQRIETVTKLSAQNISAHKICDFRPFFGLAFADLLSNYEFWGYCDIDMMFGDLKKVFTDSFLDSIDVFSAHSNQCVGHFTIVRNGDFMNNLCFQIPNWKELCTSGRAEHVDEERFSEVFKDNRQIRWARPEALEIELKKEFCRFGITFTFFGKIADLNAKDAAVEWNRGESFFQAANWRRCEVLYVHFMAIKHPWHWWFLRDRDQERHIFSGIGYGGISKWNDLARLHWRLLYLFQSFTTKSKVTVGAMLKKILPPSGVRRLRQLVRV